MPKPCDSSHSNYDNFTIGSNVVATALRWIYIYNFCKLAPISFSVSRPFLMSLDVLDGPPGVKIRYSWATS